MSRVCPCLLSGGGHGPMVVVAQERKRLTEKKYGGTERVRDRGSIAFGKEQGLGGALSRNRF